VRHLGASGRVAHPIENLLSPVSSNQAVVDRATIDSYLATGLVLLLAHLEHLSS